MWKLQWRHFDKKESDEFRMWKLLPHRGHLDVAKSTVATQSRTNHTPKKMPACSMDDTSFKITMVAGM